MALTTAAVVSAVAATAATGMQAAQSAGAFGSSGEGRDPKIYRTPEDPQDRAMKDYSYRLAMTNIDKTYPSFMEFLQSGGDQAKAKFDLTVPEMTPEEAAALRFTGGRGENIPELSQADLDRGSMTPEQRMYLARSRARDAWASGQKPGGWAARGQNAWERIHRFGKRAEELAALPSTPRRERRIERLQEKKAGTMGRWGLGEEDI